MTASLSFKEKILWIQFIASTVALGGYFIAAWVLYASGVGELRPYAPLLLLALLTMGVILILGYIIATRLGKWEKPDERDRLIQWRSESDSSWVLIVGIVAAFMCMVLSFNTVLVAHVLLLSLFVKQMLQFALQIIYYRRGM